MTFDEYWERCCQATPDLRDGRNKMTITVLSFKSFLKRTFERGASTEEATKAAAVEFEKVQRPGVPRTPFDALSGMDNLRDIFGGGL